MTKNDKSDGICWHGNECNKFPIKRIMDNLYTLSAPALPMSISSLIWRIKAPPRASIVIWLACLEKLKTGDFLVGKGLLDTSNALCPLCNAEFKTNSHILFSCSFSWGVWMMILDW